MSGYGIGDNGRKDLIGSIMLLGPDGKLVFEDKSQLNMKTDKGTTEAGFLMFDAMLEIVLEDTDPLGVYTVKTVVKDNILGKTALDEHKITLKEKSEAPLSGSGFYSEEAFGKWITYYYMYPESGKIPAAIKYYADSAIFGKASSRLPMVAFFAAIFKNYPSKKNPGHPR